MSASGDPHLVNVRGQRFDVLRPGPHVLLHVPSQEPDPARVFLHVGAEAEQLGGACADTYFTSVNITGKWTEPEAQKRGLGEGRGLVLRADGGAAARPGAAWMLFGKVSLKVVRGRTRAGTAYLNIYARDLMQAGYLIGGLLGLDDHTEVATPSVDCTRTVVLLADQPTLTVHGGV